MTVRKYIILIPITIIIAIGIVALLAWESLKPTKINSDFNRSFISADLKLKSVMANQGIARLSGYTNRHLYFQTKDPSLIVTTDYSLNVMNKITLNIPNNGRMSSGFTTYVDSPYISVLAGRASVVIKTDMHKDINEVYKTPFKIYTRSVKISPTSYIVRGVDTTVRAFDQIIMKINPNVASVSREKNISEVNGDAGLSTDGMFSYDSINHLIIYTLFYENKFICIDTNLNVIYKTKTVDNTKHYPIKSTINRNVLTAATPKQIVNNHALINNGWLFINSGIKANNENRDTLNHNSIVDIYDIKSGKYKGTFYVPEYNGEKMRRFDIVNKNLIAIYRSNVVLYHLELQ